MDTLPPEGILTEVKLSAALASRGISITRRLVIYAYARNGNWHNPTPKYEWIVRYNGRIIGQEQLLRSAKEFAAEYLATPPSER